MFGIKDIKNQIRELKDRLSSFDTVSKTDAEKSRNDLESKIKSDVSEINDKSLKQIKDIEEQHEKNIVKMESQIDYGIKANIENSNIHLKRIEDKLRNDFEIKFIEASREMDRKYMEAIDRVFSLNRDLSLMSVLGSKVNKEELTQPLLEMKWAKNKEIEGEKIVSSGVKVIEKRKSLYDEVLQIEKSGGDVSRLKEQLKSFDWILEVIK